MLAPRQSISDVGFRIAVWKPANFGDAQMPSALKRDVMLSAIMTAIKHLGCQNRQPTFAQK